MNFKSAFALAALLSFSTAYAADTVGTTQDDPARDAAMQSSPTPSKSVTKGSQIEFSNRAKPRTSKGRGKPGGYMPPAGSAATGGTSSSPGGLQQTPYGNPQ